MPRDYKVCLEDILEAVGRIRSYTLDLTLDAFRVDFKTFDAVVRNLEIIGEATKGIPDSVRLKYPEVDWNRIRALRNILIHEYFGVDAEIVWDVVQNKVTALEKLAQKILQA